MLIKILSSLVVLTYVIFVSVLMSKGIGIAAILGEAFGTGIIFLVIFAVVYVLVKKRLTRAVLYSVLAYLPVAGFQALGVIGRRGSIGAFVMEQANFFLLFASIIALVAIFGGSAEKPIAEPTEEKANG